MSKRYFNILLLTAITSGISGGFMMIINKSHEKELQKAKIASLPSFADLKGLDDFKRDTPSVFIAFHPECEHCQYEAKSINEKQAAFQNIQFVLFTSASDSVMRSFSKIYGLDTLKNVTVLSDSTGELRRLFDVKKIPTILIYNAQNQFVKRFNGETKIEAIIKYATPSKF